MTALPRRMALEVLTGGDLAVIDELLDRGFVDHNALPGSPPGPDGFKQAVDVLRTAFPDLAVTPLSYIVDGEMVAEHTESAGTHDGPFLGVAPTHRPVSISAIVIIRVNGEGRIVERWGQFNVFELLQQVGAVPGGPGGPQPRPPVPSVAGADRAPDENRAVFARYAEGVWSRADPTIADEVIHPAAVIPYNPELPAGPAGTMAWVGMLRAAFPDLRVALEHVVADRDQACGRMVLRGTHRGPFFGVPPTGRPLEIEQMVLARMVDGRIVSTWLETDLAGAMQQLGVVPGSAGPAGRPHG